MPGECRRERLLADVLTLHERLPELKLPTYDNRLRKRLRKAAQAEDLLL